MIRENMKERISIPYVMYFLFVLLTIYQDSPFSLIVGAAGYSIVMPLSILFFFIVIAIEKFRIRRFKEIKTLWILAVWLVFSSIFGIIVWGLLGNRLTIVGEFMPYKALKVWLQYISIPMYIYIMLCFTKGINNLELIFIPIFVSLIIMAVFCLLELTQIPYAFEWLHFAGEFPYYRVRLLTLESSTTASLILIYAGLSMYYAFLYKRKMVALITILCTLILTVSSSSKTFLFSIILFFVIYILITPKKISRKKFFSIVFLCVFFAFSCIYYLLPYLSKYLVNDIRDYTSFITRVYSIVIGFCIGVVFPAGVGCGAYIGFYQTALRKYIYLLTNLPILFNLQEIELYANQNTDSALSVKSGLINYNLYWGILGMIVLISVFVDLYKKLKHLDIPHINIFKALYITSIILTVIGNLGFETWLLVVIAIFMSKKFQYIEANKQFREPEKKKVTYFKKE